MMMSTPTSSLEQTQLQAFGQLTRNMLQSFMQDTGFFKTASAPLASLLLVNTRVIVAKQSAEKVKNSPDPDEAQFAEVEALKTIVREWGGVLSSFGLMAVFNIAMDRPSQYLFGIDVTKVGVVGPVQYISQSLQLLLGSKLQVAPAPVALGSQQYMHVRENPTALQKTARGLLHSLASFQKESILHKTAEALALPKAQLTPAQTEEGLLKAGMNRWRNVAVPLMGLGIAVGVAGWLLERSTLLRFDKIIQRIKILKASSASSPMKQSASTQLSDSSQPTPLQSANLAEPSAKVTALTLSPAPSEVPHALNRTQTQTRLHNQPLSTSSLVSSLRI
jgi:hypothetical protein